MSRLVVTAALGLALAFVPAAGGAGLPDSVSASGMAIISDAPGFPARRPTRR